MIKEGATVEVNYELFIDDENGELVESTLEQGPMRFTFKVDPMIEGFEKGLAGLNVGDEFRISIPCAEAYGEEQEEYYMEFPKSDFMEEDG
jgi:FKBP-type peptidyl-prolyl cis-trans isomerase 2